MEVIGEGTNAKYIIGPLNWQGTLTLKLPDSKFGLEHIYYRMEIAEFGQRSIFEYFTDEQMQELFLAYIALREAVDAD